MRISFDFDNTLYHCFGYDGKDGINHQMAEIQLLAKKYISDGHDVFIVTRRYDSTNRNSGLRYEHLLVYDVAFRLGISPDRVYFTNRELKSTILIKLKIDRHFDDDDLECEMIEKSNKMMLDGFKIEVIPVSDPYWRDLI